VNITVTYSLRFGFGKELLNTLDHQNSDRYLRKLWPAPAFPSALNL
jgi:hypothetical protein